MLAPDPKAIRMALLVALTTAAFSTHAVAQSPASDPEVQAQIDLFSAWLDGQIEIRGLPGIVVGVVAGEDLMWAKAFGHADIDADRPMRTDTRFRMASHSKLFTATAIMQLREQRKVRLDDPVSDYLPWFTFQGAAPDDPPVTIEHLLTHSSGLPREAGSHWTDWDFPTADEVRELMPHRQAPFSPEVRWKYSNLAYTIAGMVVEQISERLVLMSPWAGSIGEPRQLEPVGDGTFRLMAPTGGSAVGEIVRFVEEDGEVVRMITGDSYSNRIR